MGLSVHKLTTSTGGNVQTPTELLTQLLKDHRIIGISYDEISGYWCDVCGVNVDELDFRHKSLDGPKFPHKDTCIIKNLWQWQKEQG